MKLIGLLFVLISSLSAYELESNVKDLERHLFTYYKMMGLYYDVGEYKKSIVELNNSIITAEPFVNNNKNTFETKENVKW